MAILNVGFSLEQDVTAMRDVRRPVVPAQNLQTFVVGLPIVALFLPGAMPGQFVAEREISLRPSLNLVGRRRIVIPLTAVMRRGLLPEVMMPMGILPTVFVIFPKGF
ncbi:MAG: hypothetical protein H5T64_11005 [Chloroflexi bacterium]|nr:hypothetical protein [Chloroflexota bacterium]